MKEDPIRFAFTTRVPLAVMLALGLKQWENRNMMPTQSRGRCALSCSKSSDEYEYDNFIDWACRVMPKEVFGLIPRWGVVRDWPGKIVAVCDYEASTEPGDLFWDEGYDVWWHIANTFLLDRPIPCRGNVGMWQMPPELARQVAAADALASCVGEKIATPTNALRLFQNAVPVVGGNEGLFVLPLDENRRALSEPVLVSLGDPSTTVVQPGEVFAVAFKSAASAIILAHNHPSGDLTPSVQDRQLTAAVAALGDQLGIKVLDHLVMGGENNVSLMSKIG